MGALSQASQTSLPLIRHDLHTHTTYSDGGHDVALQIWLARAFELEAVAITDHVVPGSRLHQSEETFVAYCAEIERLRVGLTDVIVLKGAEAVALDTQGNISLGPDRASRLEWVLCDLGGASEGTLRNTPQNKQRYIDNVISTYMGLCDVPYLNGIAHPFNTGNTSPALLPAEYPEQALRELALKMAERHIVFDVMNLQAFWFQRSGISPAELTTQYAALVRLFAEAGVVFQVSSDDHRCGIGHTLWSQRILALAGVLPQQIVNPADIRPPGQS